MQIIEQAIDAYTHMPLEGDKPDDQTYYYDTLETVMENVAVEETKKSGLFKKIKVKTTKDIPCDGIRTGVQTREPAGP